MKQKSKIKGITLIALVITIALNCQRSGRKKEERAKKIKKKKQIIYVEYDEILKVRVEKREIIEYNKKVVNKDKNNIKNDKS